MTKRVLALFFPMVILLFLLGCQEVDEDMLFLQKDVSKELPLSDKPIINPFMGYAPCADCEEEAEQASMVYVDVTFRELQPNNEHEFDFEGIEKRNFLHRWRSEGKHVVFRFVCDKPSKTEHLDIPDWLYEKIDGDGTEYDMKYGKGFAPDYNNPVFIEYHAKAIKALGEYFGKDNFFSYIELGSLGHWGEWHVNYEAGIQRLPQADVREQYIAPYLEAFPHAKLMMRRPFEAAKAYGFGLYNDMTGEPESTATWLDWIQNGGDFNQTMEKGALVPMSDAWKTAPIGGEMTSSLAMDYLIKTNIEQTAAMVAESHTTFLGPKTPLRSDDRYSTDGLYRQGTDTLLKSMGYRIGISKVEISKIHSSGIVAAELTWHNGGVAPLYFDLPVYLYVLDKAHTVQTCSLVDLKLTSLLPGKTIKTTTKIQLAREIDSSSGPLVPAGTSICIGIVDPMTGRSAVALANDVSIIDGRMQLHQYS